MVVLSPDPTGAVTPTDEMLVAAYRQTGDHDAIDTLVRRYSLRLRRMVITLVGTDSAMVEDAEQEVLVTLIRRLRQFKGRSSFRTFFYRLARNRVLDIIRTRNRYRSRVMNLSEPDRTSGRLKGPEQLTLDTERAALLRRAMECLSAEDRMLLYLKDGEDEGIADLAALTGLSDGTIKSRLARGRAKVARALEELGYEH